MDFAVLIDSMINAQLKRRGINDQRILKAFSEVPRHEFVGADLVSSAYDDCPLPIGAGQTISQPYMAALMSQILAINPEDRVLEIGTGSGYQTAILAVLAKEVYSVERIERLSSEAKKRFEKLGINNINLNSGDGSLGLKEFAPYDAIIVTAAAPSVPQSLIEQMAEGARLVVPVGGRSSQELMLIEKKQGKIKQSEMGGCVFVPLIGEKGWTEYDY